MAGLVKVDKYNFAGVSLTDSDKEDFHSVLLSVSKDFPHALKHTEKRLKELTEMSACIEAFGRTLGLDLSDTLVQDYDRQVRFFTRWGFEEVRESCDAPSWVNGVKHYSTIYMKEHDRTADTYGAITHELIHLAGFNLIMIEENGEDHLFEHVQSGYHDLYTGDFACFSEALTELTKLDVVRNYWSANDKLSGYYAEHPEVAYEASVSFIDALFVDLAQRTGFDYGTTLQMFQRGYFLGNDKPLSVIAEQYGPPALDFISSLPEDVDEFIEVAAESDLGREIGFEKRVPHLDELRLRLALYGNKF